MHQGTCRFCGNNTDGIWFDNWVKPTFTDYDKLLPGDLVCSKCLFWFDESSEELTRITGKDKLQRMRNYSHFIVHEQWIPLSKGDKATMQTLLLSAPFPELAVIAESGQKHIAFRATYNAEDGASGWVQFEEQKMWVDPAELSEQLRVIERLYTIFSKTEIETGRYSPNRILAFGIAEWRVEEHLIKAWRRSLLFSLALFLAQQRSDSEPGGATEPGGGDADGDLARDIERPQEPLPDVHLA